jgi:hypothetical protein
MSPHAILFLLGLFLAVLPFLGFPRSWDDVLVTLAGLGCIVLSLIMRRERRLPADGAGRAAVPPEASVESEPPESARRVQIAPDVVETVDQPTSVETPRSNEQDPLAASPK